MDLVAEFWSLRGKKQKSLAAREPFALIRRLTYHTASDTAD
jgi:hypothetical protein